MMQLVAKLWQVYFSWDTTGSIKDSLSHGIGSKSGIIVLGRLAKGLDGCEFMNELYS